MIASAMYYLNRTKKLNMDTLYKYVRTIIFLCLFAGCTTSEEYFPEMKQYLSIKAVIGKTSLVTTKAHNIYSHSFENGDQIGFYSEGGGANGTALKNFPLTYQGGTFNDKTQQVNISQLGNIYAYYPYNSNMEEENGMPVREENTNSCVDFLIAFDMAYSEGAMGTNFYHAFSRLEITLGEGFNKAKDQEITVTLNRPVKNIKLEDKWGVYGMKSMTFPQEADEQYKSFKAQIMDVPDNPYNDPKGDNGTTLMYCVILPCSADITAEDYKNPDYICIESIQLNDNNNKSHTIWNPALPQWEWKADKSKLSSNRRYQIEIEMNGLTPTIYKHSISEWEENDITQKLEVGINSPIGLSQWITAYNSKYENELIKYGSKTEDGHWTFEILADIDCSSLISTIPAHFIDKLTNTTIKGNGHTLSNLTLSSKTGSNNVGFIGMIGEGGLLENLHLSEVQITGADSNIGIFAGNVNGGALTGCTVQNFRIIGTGYVGILAGSISSGTISGCTATDGWIQGGNGEVVGLTTGGTLGNNNNINRVITVQ